MSGRVEIRYRHPAPIGVPLHIMATLVRDRKRALELKGEARLPDGTVVAEASGVYMRVPDDLRRTLEQQIADGF